MIETIMSIAATFITPIKTTYFLLSLPRDTPPKLVIQYGVLVTSTKRTGSQKPIDIPGVGIFALVHIQIGLLGFLVSLFLGAIPLPIFMLPIEIGNMQDQHISVMGLTNLP